MKPLQWFRLYAEFATDPVMQSLSFDDQRHFIMFLCFKASGLLDRQFGHPQMRDDVIRKSIGLDGKAWDEMRNRLSVCGLIDGDLQPINWDKRQFISDHDSSVQRVRKWRENKRLEEGGDEKRTCNGRVTDAKPLPESETETETETEKREKKGEARATRLAIDSLPPDWAEFCRKERPDLDPQGTFDRFCDHWKAKPGKDGRKLDWLRTWRNWVRSERAWHASPPKEDPQAWMDKAL